MFSSLPSNSASTEVGKKWERSILLADEAGNSIQMTFALQSNKISSICLTVRYFKIGFTTEHFQNPIAMLNNQPLGQLWGGGKEMEAEKLREIPVS